MDGALREFSARHPRLPRPGHDAAYVESEVTPAAWPTERSVTPLHRVAAHDPGNPPAPRRSPPLLVDGGVTTFYWCRACNRCLRHWRSAFCDIHRPLYKKARRRQRESTTNLVSVDRDLLEAVYDAASAYLEAEHEKRYAAGEPAVATDRNDPSRLAIGTLLTLVMRRIPDYL